MCTTAAMQRLGDFTGDALGDVTFGLSEKAGLTGEKLGKVAPYAFAPTALIAGTEAAGKALTPDITLPQGSQPLQQTETVLARRNRSLLSS